MSDAFERATDLMAMWLARFRIGDPGSDEQPTENERLTAGLLAGSLWANNLLAASPSPPVPGVTEEMVEVGARVIAECARTGIIEAPKLGWPCWMGTSRAVLTAALTLPAQLDSRDEKAAE